MPPPKKPADASAEPIAYVDAIAELNEILAALEDESIDIDTLGDRVARAHELITACRDRISLARLRVTEIVADLDRPANGAPPVDGDAVGHDAALGGFENERDD